MPVHKSLRASSHIYSSQSRRNTHFEDEQGAARGSQITHSCITDCVLHDRFSNVKCSAECHRASGGSAVSAPTPINASRPSIRLQHFDYRGQKAVYAPLNLYSSSTDGPIRTNMRAHALRSGRVW